MRAVRRGNTTPSCAHVGTRGGSHRRWPRDSVAPILIGKILTWDPPHVFEHERNADPGGWIIAAERSIIRWELIPREGGTLFRLVHRLLTPTLAIKIAPATHVLLDRIEDELVERDSADFMTAVQRVGSLYPTRAP